MSQQYPQNYPANQTPAYRPATSPDGRVSYTDPALQQGLYVNNELMRVATPLITLITQIRHTISHPNVPALRAQIIEEIKIFERKLVDAQYPIRTIVASRYCLCTAIDEAVLSQDWGAQSVWVEGSLLSIFQKETWGGERFYIILEDALRDTRSNIDFIEFIYFLISLGFEGKFFGEDQRATREEIRGRIFYHIRHARVKPERNLSLRWKNVEAPETQRQRKSILKRLVITMLSLIVALAVFYNIRVFNMASPVLAKLNKLGNVPSVTTFSQVIGRPAVIRNDDEGEM